MRPLSAIFGRRRTVPAPAVARSNTERARDQPFPPPDEADQWSEPVTWGTRRPHPRIFSAHGFGQPLGDGPGTNPGRITVHPEVSAMTLETVCCGELCCPHCACVSGQPCDCPRCPCQLSQASNT